MDIDYLRTHKNRPTYYSFSPKYEKLHVFSYLIRKNDIDSFFLQTLRQPTVVMKNNMDDFDKNKFSNVIKIIQQLKNELSTQIFCRLRLKLFVHKQLNTI